MNNVPIWDILSIGGSRALSRPTIEGGIETITVQITRNLKTGTRPILFKVAEEVLKEPLPKP